MPKSIGRWSAVVLFAIAMAWVEAAVVYYLRLWMGGNMTPYQPNPIPDWPQVGPTEVIREAATLIMLFTVGFLAGRNWRMRLGYFLIAFGIWDMFYYVFLRVITGWPQSLLDWDILFLIPLPWWGPVLAPVSIALLMVLWGTLVTQRTGWEQPLPHTWKVWVITSLGIGLALLVFMADAIRLLRAGQPLEQLRNMLPSSFNWPLFLVALVLMAAPVLDFSRQLWQRNALHEPLLPTGPEIHRKLSSSKKPNPRT